jgi:alkylation response protein AidB-like acyl-CoA dehydrogenase
VTDNPIAEAVARIFADLADPQTLNAARDERWRAPLWAALEETGLTRAWVPEAQGGAGATLADGFEVLRIAGQYACPVALAETLLAGWALAEAGLGVSEGVLAVAPVRARDRLTLNPDGTLSGVARAVPHAGEAELLVLVLHDQLLTFRRGAWAATPRPTDMGAERADLSFDAAMPEAMADMPGGGEALMRMGAVARSCQMAGALETALKLTVDYTQEREAFGRKIGKFQAVQQNLAVLAGEVAAALSAAGSAADTLASEPHAGEAAFLETASTKIRVGEAVETGAAIAHQAHGAIGWTQEHALQRFTRRMWGWRDDFGSEADWAVRLGGHVAATGAGRLWPMLTTR